MGGIILLLLVSLSAPTASAQPDSIDAYGWFEEYRPGCIGFQANTGGNCSYFGTDLVTLPDSIREHAFVAVHAQVIQQEWCHAYDLVIANPIVTPCEPVDLGCGVLFYDEEYCDFWDSPLYGCVAVSSFQGFASGDTVHAIGLINYCGVSTCFMPSLCCATLYSCEQSPPAAGQSTWGALKALFR